MPAKKMEHKPTMNDAFLAIAFNKTIMVYRRFAQRSVINVNTESLFQAATKKQGLKFQRSILKERESKRGKGILSEVSP